MKLVASMVVRNELGRYLQPCVEHLLAFCDELVILDDASDDGTEDYLRVLPLDERVTVVRRTKQGFFRSEGRVRQQLLEATFAQEPTHVLAIDADEFIADGARLRELLEAFPDVRLWRLPLEEVWKADADGLLIREDGGWATKPRPVLWRVPDNLSRDWRIMPRQLACGRIPIEATRAPGARTMDVPLLHFGWTDERARAARHARYAYADRGRFHAGSHLDSILWDDEKVKLRAREWPEGVVFDGLRERLVGVLT